MWNIQIKLSQLSLCTVLVALVLSWYNQFQGGLNFQELTNISFYVFQWKIFPPRTSLWSQDDTIRGEIHLHTCTPQAFHLILHADTSGIDHAITPVSLEDPVLLAWQIDQLLTAALHVLVHRRQVVAPALGALLQKMHAKFTRYIHTYRVYAYLWTCMNLLKQHTFNP